MSNSKPPPYILQELPDITDAINYPIKNVQRIKYTCFDVSKTLIAFGATSGGIYVFNRSPCEFVQLIPNKDGAITRLAISSNEKHIGFANGKGIVTVTECDQSLSGGHSTVTSRDHQGNEVTVMAWSESDMLFSGDDIGKISVLQMQNFIAKTFQSSSQVIMSLDSRICQIDLRSCMLLVSTLTRCYICDTTQEQYRQIGQKLRDGEFGACFVNKEKDQDVTVKKVEQDFKVKEFNMVNEDLKFAVGKELENTLIFCARPSSRLWESTVDGTVKRTHQFKQVLGRYPVDLVTVEDYENGKFVYENKESDHEGKSINFTKIYAMKGAIFCFTKDALFFLNIDNVDHTVWYEHQDVVDCKVHHNMLYIWLSNGSLIQLTFVKIDKFLLKCYLEEKYSMCTEICKSYRDYLMSNKLSPKLNIVSGLRDRIDKDVLDDITSILDNFESLKSNEAHTKSGIHKVDNTYLAKSSLDEDDDISKQDDYKFSTKHPEAMQTLKDLSMSVSDRLNSSKKMLKEKWEGFEDKMKLLGDKPAQEHFVQKEIIRTEVPKKTYSDEEVHIEHEPIIIDNDIIYKESSQKVIELDNNFGEEDKTSKSLYQCFRLSLVSKNMESSNLISIIETNSCDIRQIYKLMLKLEEYCIKIGAVEESKFMPNQIYLSYLAAASKKEEYLDDIIKDDEQYKYFVDSCIAVNMKTQKLLNTGCECGYPLPYARTNKIPVFSDLIDEFIERQWSNQTRDQCYDICKRMPYSWRKILYLRRNEDLMNILRILLQMLDETLLHSFLPQFTLDIWNRAVQLYATLYANICLNCSKKFENISVKDMLSWDDLGALMIKSIGGKNALKVLETNANLIDAGAITLKFYHSCLIVTMFEKYDSILTNQLTDALYSSYDCEEARDEICKLLRSSAHGQVKNTSLPIAIAANSPHWGLSPLKMLVVHETDENQTEDNETQEVLTYSTVKDIIDNIFIINKGVTDCTLCGLPLQNEVLIQDGGLWVFKCGHIFHGACLDLNKVKLCPSCTPVK